MQTKFLSAALAAVAITSVYAGAVTPRQAIKIVPGAIVLPTLVFDPSQLGLEDTAYKGLDQVRQSLVATGNLVVQLNTLAGQSIDAAQVALVLAQAQANADAIAAQVNTLIAALQSKVPTLPTAGNGGGAGGGPRPTPTLPSPSIPTETVGTTVTQIVQQIDAAKALHDQTQQQIGQIGGFLGGILNPTIIQLRNQAQNSLTSAFTQIGASITSLLGNVNTVSASALGTSDALLKRIAAAQIALNPTLIFGVSPVIGF
ncbi:hypothetical protein CPLU01_02600 [Colletotrichum plurivorum]|uniref:Cell wall protein n=1 Tax=Colletotrichum plurivorum TaxID=2175906 RepID=A0A8H6KV40_9PEZI|nr:hypothetical protein CPLU01_02600 [Colletotrichum plurivorum]